MVRWLRIRLPMQGPQVRCLAWEDLTLQRQLSPSTTATEPTRLQHGLSTTRSLCNENPTHLNQRAGSTHQRKAMLSNKDTAQPKINFKKQTGALYLNNFCKVFTKFVTILFLVYVVVFGFLTKKHMGSQVPEQGSNPHPVHWMVPTSQVPR